jgi:general secretion pathway protein I
VRRRRAQAGFTLLEVGVALAIVGMGVVVCLQVFSGSLRLQDRASRETRAVLYARAVMDALLFEREISNHTEERDTAEGYRARIVVRDAGPEDGIDFGPEFEPSLDIGLRALEVEIAWQDGVGVKTYRLKSLRMAVEEF